MWYDDITRKPKRKKKTERKHKTFRITNSSFTKFYPSKYPKSKCLIASIVILNVSIARHTFIFPLGSSEKSQMSAEVHLSLRKPGYSNGHNAPNPAVAMRWPDVTQGCLKSYDSSTGLKLYWLFYH
jgi:hypothetical protein